MPTWLALATSPIFRFALLLTVLGLLRLFLLLLWEMMIAWRKAGDRRVPFSKVIGETVSWLFPVFHMRHTRQLYSYASIIFHIGILVGGLFLGNHIDVLHANFNLTYPSLLRPLIDILVLASILAGSYLLLQRIYVLSSRKLSGGMDYLLLGLLLSITSSGFLAGQGWNPIPYDGLMLFHTICGILLLLLIPFTKIAHCILYPLIRLSTEIAWHFPSQAGSEVVEALHGTEGRKI